MKFTITILLLLFTLTVFGQNSSDFFQSGITKHEAQDYKGAIKDYTKAIKADAANKDAYFNRGTCALALKKFKNAMSDFNKAIEIDPEFAKVYYSRATVFVSQQKYKEALPDLDKAIELNPKIPNVLTLRGQIRAQTGNKNGACEDFKEAQLHGDKQAEKYLNQFCGNKQQLSESIILDWPDDENWKIGSSQENDKMAMVELIHSNETLENWTEIGSMISIKGAKNIPMNKAMNMMFDQAKNNSPKAKLTFIEKDESTEYPWIIFLIESPSFKDDQAPESQLWYITQGKTTLFTNFRGIKKTTIPKDLQNKWITFFKTAKIKRQ